MVKNLQTQLKELQSENEHLQSKDVDFTTIQILRAQVKELQSEIEHLKSKVIDCKMCQNIQVQVEEIKSVNESLNLSVEELYKARALAEAILREKDEMIFAQILDTQDNSERDLILSLQTQVKETAELVVRFSDEKHFALKEIESLKDKTKSLQIENQDLKSRDSESNNLEKVYSVKEYELLEKIEQMKSQFSELLEKFKISDQEMKQQIILFEEDKRMFLTKNKFLEKVSSSVQKDYNDLLASMMF
nr:hypothetical protein [Tanacetum cinerariifolium]